MSQPFADAALVFALQLAAHLMTSRFVKNPVFVKFSVLLFAASALVASPWLFRAGLGRGLFACALFASLWVIQMVALISGMNSVSLRMMDEVDRAPGRALEEQTLFSRITPEASVRARVDTLIKNGILVSGPEGTIQLARPARALASVARAIRRGVGAPLS